MDKSVVFSSNEGGDDGEGWGQNSGVAGNGGGQVDDGKWLKDIVETLERKCDEYNNKNVMASGDVGSSSKKCVMVGNDVGSSSKKCVMVGNDVGSSSKKCVEEYEEDDDDCVILDGDPDKAGVEGEKAAVGDDDELVVVGETGQVACRDYPHPRELCANLPFKSTPHEQYCNQCHCYVCDAPAPCLKWGTGVSIYDHCHATGKLDFWNQQRESLKQSRQSTLPVPKVQCTSMSAQPIQTDQAPASTPQIQYNIPPAEIPYNITPSEIAYDIPPAEIPYSIPPAEIPYNIPPADQIPYDIPPADQIPYDIPPADQISYTIPPAQGLVSAPIPSIQYQTSQTQVPRPAPNTNMQYQAFQAQTPMPALVWPSQTEAMNMPSIRGQSYVVPRNNLQMSLALLQSRNTGNNALARNMRNNVGILGPRVNVPHAAMFKRSGTPGFASASNQRIGHLINGHGSTIYTRVPNAVLAPDNFNNMISAQNNGNSNMWQPSIQPYIQPMPSNMMAFQSSVATTSSNRPLLSDLSSRGNVFVYSTTQPQIPSLEPQYFPSLPSLPYITRTTVLSEPPVYSQPSHASTSQQNVFEQQNQTNNFGDTGFSGIGLNWLTNTTNPSSQQTRGQNSEVQASGSFDELASLFNRR